MRQMRADELVRGDVIRLGIADYTVSKHPDHKHDVVTLVTSREGYPVPRVWQFEPYTLVKVTSRWYVDHTLAEVGL